MIRVSVGKRIKERRKELGMTVDEVASKLGKNRATIYRYESDEIENLPITVLEPLAKILNVSPSYLMGWDDDALNDIPLALLKHYQEEGMTDIEMIEAYENFKKAEMEDAKNSPQEKYIESIKLDSPEEAMKFILQQPSLMAFGGYDLNEMSEEEIMDLANDLLFAMKLSLEKHRRK